MGDDERPRLSWREIDQRRSGGSRGSDERRPRGRAAEVREAQATQEYLKDLDKMFTSSQGGAEGEELAKQVRDAHGSPELAAACAAYREAVGIPDDPSLLAIFLDASDSDTVLAALEQLLRLQSGDGLTVTPGLRAQLRVLATHSDDHIAGAAEDLLEA